MRGWTERGGPCEKNPTHRGHSQDEIRRYLWKLQEGKIELRRGIRDTGNIGANLLSKTTVSKCIEILKWEPKTGR
jgi:hypothetical protein